MCEVNSKRYKVGYLQGTFDLFHIGHLNIIINAKNLCEYLIVGAVSDELSKYYKYEYPFIPLNERIEILKSIKYVDEVIEVDFKNADKLLAWEQLRYDVHISGSDHKNHFRKLDLELQKRGACCSFLPYTESTSSTKIKSLINKRITNIESTITNYESQRRLFEAVVLAFSPVKDETKPILLYGAGEIGKLLKNKFENYGYNVEAFLDSNETLQGTYIDGVVCREPLYYKKESEKYLLVITIQDYAVVFRKLGGEYLNIIEPGWWEYIKSEV